jgi:iron(III) transport system permease protein
VFGEHLGLAEQFAALLCTTGIGHGLIGPREAPRIWERHLLNCAVVEELVPLGTAQTRLIDVGSGAGLPGLVIAIAVVFFIVQSPLSDLLYQTYTLLLLAYAVHFGAHSLRASQVAVGAVPRRVEDAARSLGAKTPRRLGTVTLPLMRPGLLAGAGLVLLSTMKELPATLILAPTGTKTLATEIWSSSSEGFFAQAGLASLTLIGLSAALTWLLVIRGREVAA